MKEIIIADNSGFCFGVENAIKKAISATSAEAINTYGALIHNKRVTDYLANRGIGMVEDPAEAPAHSTLIVRSHGAPEALFKRAEELELNVIDATCPYVLRIQRLVKKAYEKGFQVLIVGDASHPEVIGINGWIENSGVVISNFSSCQDIYDRMEGVEKLYVVAQTTIRKELYDSVIDCLDNSPIDFVDFHHENTICSATTRRQEGCEKTAKQVDLMLIIGDKTSSNTKKLYEIAKKYCKKSFFIENISDLPLKEIEKCNRIGVAAGASTPEYAIKEVIANMSDNTLENELTMDDFMEEIDKSLRLPRAGELVTGKIHQVTDREIIVNLGCKKDGIIPFNEISPEDDRKLTELFREGDDIQAKVIKTDDGDGTILLSKKKLEAGEHWAEINTALEEKTLIDVHVVRQVNGGVIATYKEISGFIPLSQLSDRFVEDSSEFLGQTLSVKVSRVDPRRGKAVFSHKAHLSEERSKAMEAIWENIKVGDVVEGTVMRFTDYGAFVDIGGIDGLLHISEISWGKLKHPKEVLKINEKISVMILSMNSEKGKISLGYKQTKPEPWSVIEDNYKLGDVVSGRVVQIKEYGCFVELEPGLDGLVHISEVSHRKVGNINDEVQIGKLVDTKILEIDRERKRISLSIKENISPEEEDEMKADLDATSEVSETLEATENIEVEAANEAATDVTAEEKTEE